MTAILGRLLLSLVLLVGASNVEPATAVAAAASNAASAAQPAVSTSAIRAAPAASAAGIASSQPSPAASSYQPRLKPYAEDVGAVFSVFSSLLIAVALLGAAWLMIKEWRREPLIIEPFDVPKDLLDMGLTGSVVSQQLADQILELQRSAKADDGPADIAFVELPRMQVDLQLPGVAWSVRGAIRYLKQALNKSERRLLGEIVRSADGYRMRVRSTQGRALDVPTRFLGAPDIGDTLEAAAECAISLMNTLEAATIMYSLETPASGYARTLEAIRLHLRTASVHTHQDAYVLWASVRKALGDRVGMEEMLELARACDTSSWSGRETGTLRTRYLNFTGGLHREQKEFDLAERAFKAALKIDRRNLGALSNLGLLAVDRQDAEEARRWSLKLVRLRPTSSRGYRGLGLAAALEARWHDSLRYFTRAVDVAPGARWPRLNRIDSYRLIGDFDAAERDAQDLLAVDTRFAPLYRFWCLLARDQDDVLSAARHARKAVETDPSDPWNQIESARVAIARGERDRAVALARRALSLRPNMPEGFRCWAQALAYGGDAGQAILKYEEGSVRSPSDPWCLLELSDLHRRQGRFDQAISAASRVLQRNKRWTAEALRRIAWALRDSGDPAGAEKRLRAAASALPTEPWALIELSDLLRQQCRFAESAAAAESALKTRIRPAYAYRQWAKTLQAQNSVSEAESTLRQALAEQPSDLWAALDLVDLLKDNERHAEALALLQEAKARWPNSAHLLRHWARVLQDLGDLDGARAKLARAAELSPGDIDGLRETADFLRSTNQLADSADFVERSISIRADLSIGLRNRAWLYQKQGDLEAAEAALHAAVDREPDVLQRRLELSDALSRWGRHQEALEIAEGLLKQRPADADALRHCARSKRGLGDLAAARRMFEAAAQAMPRDISCMLELAEFLSANKHKADALAAANQALEVDPLSLAAVRCIASINQESGDDAAAMTTLERAVEMAPTEVDDLVRIADIERRRGRFEQARSRLQAALDRRPTSLKVLRSMLDLQISQDEWNAARTTLDRLCALAPVETQDLIKWGQARARGGAIDEALAATETACARQRSGQALYEWGVLLAGNNEPQRAESRFREAIAAAPWEQQHALNFAARLERSGRRAEAIVVLENACALRSKSPALRGALAVLLLKDGDKLAAGQQLHQAIRTTSAGNEWEMLELSGWFEEFEYFQEAVSHAKHAAALGAPKVYYLRRAAGVLNRHADPRGAIELLRAAIGLKPADRLLWSDLAEALFAVGDKPGAVEACNKVLSLEPGDWSATQLLKKLGGPAPPP